MPDPPKSDVRQFIQASPVLHVADVRRTAEHYRDVLGFTLDFVYGDPPTYAVVWRENAAVHFWRRDPPTRDAHVFLWVRDVDRLHDEYRASGAAVVEPPATRPYGVREMVVKDPNGVTLVFGQDDEAAG